MADTEVRLGDLRWRVALVTRQQAADPNGTGILETPADARWMYAKIEALRPLTFWTAAQTESEPPTHQITVRWVDYLDNTHAFVRQTRRPTDGAIRAEVFRVRRVTEINGRKRFSACECELEAGGWQAPLAPIPADTLPSIGPNGRPANTAGLLP